MFYRPVMCQKLNIQICTPVKCMVTKIKNLHKLQTPFCNTFKVLLQLLSVIDTIYSDILYSFPQTCRLQLKYQNNVQTTILGMHEDGCKQTMPVAFFISKGEQEHLKKREKKNSGEEEICFLASRILQFAQDIL